MHCEAVIIHPSPGNDKSTRPIPAKVFVGSARTTIDPAAVSRRPNARPGLPHSRKLNFLAQLARVPDRITITCVSERSQRWTNICEISSWIHRIPFIIIIIIACHLFHGGRRLSLHCRLSMAKRIQTNTNEFRIVHASPIGYILRSCSSLSTALSSPFHFFINYQSLHSTGPHQMSKVLHFS